MPALLPCYSRAEGTLSVCLCVCLSHVFSPPLKSCLQLSQPLHSSTHGHLAPTDHLLAAFAAVVDPSFLSLFPQYRNSSYLPSLF